MAATANVQSIAALKEFRLALCLFTEAARSALGEADADLQRHGSWLSDDRKRFWQSEVNRRNERLQQARLLLLRKKMEKTAGGGKQSCVDEEKALAQAQRQFEEAQQKAEHTKRWVRRLDELVFQHKGTLQSLSFALENDVVNMLALLDRMVDSLNQYVALAAPSGAGFKPTTSDTESMTRPAIEPAIEDLQNVQQQEDTKTAGSAKQTADTSTQDTITPQEHDA